MKKITIMLLLAVHSTMLFADMLPSPLPGSPYTIPLPESSKETSTTTQDAEPDSKLSQASPKTEIATLNKEEKLEALVEQQAKKIIQLEEKVDSLEKRVSLIENLKKKK